MCLYPVSQARTDWKKTQMVAAMKPGSVIVDLAAEAGGNCELTAPGQLVTHNRVTIIGWLNHGFISHALELTSLFL